MRLVARQGDPGPPSSSTARSPLASLARGVIAHFGARLQGRVIALWGLGLTPDCAQLIDAVAGRGAVLVAWDPLVRLAGRGHILESAALRFAANRMNALNGADALLIVTDWREFRCVDAAELRERMRAPLLFDPHGLYDREAMQRQGVDYRGIGRAQRGDLVRRAPAHAAGC